MPNSILHKRGTTVPGAASLLTGELAINTATGVIYTKTDGGTVVAVNGAPVNNPTFTGKVTTAASTTTTAGLIIPHGTAPTSPVNGDIWTTTSGLFMRQNGSTQQYMDLGGTQTISGAKTFSSNTLTFSNAAGTSTTNIATGATASATTKTVNIGTGGVAGSTTNINIGTTTGTATATVNALLSTRASATTGAGLRIVPGVAPTSPVNGDLWATTTDLQVRLNGVTETLAEQSWVTAQGYALTSSLASYAPLASPSLTGVPLSTTAAADTNTTQIATTAYVVGQAGSSTPLVNGTAAVGTSLRYARADHVHPTDTTRAPLDSPAFTGTPSAVTQAAGNNTTALATTAFVTAAVPAIATVAQVNNPNLNTVAMSPDRVRQMLMFPGFQEFLGGGVIATSGTGAAGPSLTARWRQLVGPNAAVAGYSTFVFDTHASAYGFIGSKRGDGQIGKSFARRFWFGSRTTIGIDQGFPGDANNLYRCELGGRNGLGATGDPTMQGIGWRVAGGSTGAIVFYMRTRSAVNGGTYTTVTTTFTPTAQVWFDWMITYDGTGTAQMFVNDTLVGTISASFTGFQEPYNHYVEQVEQTASAATRLAVNQLPTRVYFSE